MRFLLLALLLLSMAALCRAAVIGIDFGSQNVKVALIKPGKPVTVVLNDQSKRKTPNAVAFHKVSDERFVGADALALNGRQPQLVFQNIKYLLGKKYSPSLDAYFRSLNLPYTLKPTEDGARVRIQKKDTSFSPEEILAQVFQYIRKIAIKHAGADVRDAVITVPNYFTAAERRALTDAAELAGLKVLSLLGDTTAVAMGFGIERRFEQPQSYIFYDMGAQGVKVSLVHFSKRPTKTTPGTVVVRNTQWDRTVGGDQFDARLVEYFAQEFAKQPGVDIDPRSKPRIMAKLAKVATKAKEVLSANTETVASIESLYNDADFRVHLTRSQFEELCADLLQDAVEPLRRLQKEANVNFDDIVDLEMFGSGARIPRLQQMLADVFGRPLAKHVNADEAAVVGATYQAAKLSASFHVRFEAVDVAAHQIQVGKLGHRATTLYAATNKCNTKKMLTFNKIEDVTLETRYLLDDAEQLLLEPVISQTEVTGVQANFVDKFNDTGLNITGAPKIQVTFNLDGNGYFRVRKADVTVTESYPVQVEVKPTKEELAARKKAAKAAKGDDDDEDDEPLVDPEPVYTTVFKKRSHKYALDVATRNDQAAGIDAKARAISLAVLRTIDTLEAERQQTAVAKNSLESYIYTTKDKLSDEGVESVSTPEQRERVGKALDDAGEWLYDEGEDTTASAYLAKLQECKDTGAEAIFLRHAELSKRPRAAAALRKASELAAKKLAEWRADKYAGPSKSELDMLEELIDSAEQWLSKKLAEQDKRKGHEELVVLSADIQARAKDIGRRLTTLSKKPRKPTPTPTPTPKPKKASKKAQQDIADADAEPEPQPDADANADANADDDEEADADADAQPQQDVDEEEHED